MATKPNVHAHLQNATAPWSCLLVIPRGTAATTLIKPPAGFALRVVQGKKCKTPAGIFREFARAFEFPDYCDCNWDSLEECLTDLEWLPAKGYVVLIHDAQSVIPDDEEEYETLLEVFNDVGEAWSKGQTSNSRRAPFHVLFGVSRQDKLKRKHWGLEELPFSAPKRSMLKGHRYPGVSQSPRKKRF
jgi:RNAse (barnase) inhibitor barstar